MRAALLGLPEQEVDDILRELQSHADELAEGQGVEAALRSLGDPVDMARTYRAEKLMARAECSGSPLVILEGLRNSSLRRSRRVTVTALYISGYANVIVLWTAGLEKLLSPSRTGLWYMPGNIWSLRLITDGTAPAGGRELLGWWLGANRHCGGLDSALRSRFCGAMVDTPGSPEERVSWLVKFQIQRCRII